MRMTVLDASVRARVDGARRRQPEAERKEVITPELAAEWLTYRNPRNRTIKTHRVKQYADAMLAGEWHYNGEAIQVDWHGDLLNGQHRLKAIVMSGVTVKILFVYGIDPAVFDTYDSGAGRTAGDALGIDGVKYGKTIAAAARLIFAYERTGVPVASFTVQPQTRAIRDIRARHDIEGSINAGGHTQGILTVSRASVVALHYLFASADRHAADEFFVAFSHGEGLPAGDPVLALRSRLMSSIQRRERLSKIDSTALVIRAWNGWRKHERLARMLTLDIFPMIEGCTVPILGDGTTPPSLRRP